MISNNRRWKEEELHGNRLTPQLLFVKSFIADVKREQEQAAGLQHSFHFSKCERERGLGKVHDGVEGGNAGKRSVLKIQGQHISFAERNVRVEFSGLLQHSRREVETENRGTRIAQV